MAVQSGLKGIHFVGRMENLFSRNIDNDNSLKYSIPNINKDASKNYNYLLNLGFDAVNSWGLYRSEVLSRGLLYKYYARFFNKVFKGIVTEKYRYKDIIKHYFVEEDKWENVYPTIIPNYDRSPRSGKKIKYGTEAPLNCLKNMYKKLLRL